MARPVIRNSSSPSESRVKFGELLEEPELWDDEKRYSHASEFSTTTASSSSASPRISSFCNIDDHYSTTPSHNSSPWTQSSSSPYLKSPWVKLSPYPHPTPVNDNTTPNNIYYSRGTDCLVGSLLREEGHIYSLAAKDGMLYTGSQSKNIRVWRDLNDAGGFKSGSGLVKAIVISSKDKRVFTGHQDGKIRIWSSKGKRIGTLPKLGDYLRSSLSPRSYVEARRHRKVPRVRHFDAVSCMSLNETEEAGLLYSGSWDKTIKVWRMEDGKCLESIEAHDDAINSIVVGFEGLVFSGSADGSVKVWRRELDGKKARHVHVTTLLTQENAVTALAVGDAGLYAGSSDGLINFWESEKKELCYGGVLRGHKSAVLCLATAGSLVLSGSADKTICVWKREDADADADADAEGIHSCLAVLSAHTGPVKCLAIEQFDQDQWVVYSGSLDKSVKIWRVSEHVPDDELIY